MSEKSYCFFLFSLILYGLYYCNRPKMSREKKKKNENFLIFFPSLTVKFTSLTRNLVFAVKKALLAMVNILLAMLILLFA